MSPRGKSLSGICSRGHKLSERVSHIHSPLAVQGCREAGSDWGSTCICSHVNRDEPVSESVGSS